MRKILSVLKKGLPLLVVFFWDAKDCWVRKILRILKILKIGLPVNYLITTGRTKHCKGVKHHKGQQTDKESQMMY